jgi:hypothetical protein
MYGLPSTYIMSSGTNWAASEESIRDRQALVWLCKVQQTLPSTVQLSVPVVIYTAIGELFPFFLETIGSAEVCQILSTNCAN